MKRHILFVICLFFFIAGADEASAHAFLMETFPLDGAELAQSPADIRLTFNEVVTPALIAVDNAGGVAVTAPDTWRIDGANVILPLPPALPDGVYAIRYRVAAMDGHPSVGSIAFGIGVKPPAEGVPDDAPAQSVPIMTTVVRALHFIALLGGLGGGLFLALVARAVPRFTATPLVRGLMIADGIAALTAVVLVGLQGGALTGGGLSTLTGTAPWRIGFGLAGPSALFAVAGASIAIIGLNRGRAVWLVLGAVIGAVSPTLTGHIATVSPGWFGVGLGTVHVLLGMFWGGALVPLLLALRALPGEAALVLLRRFSRLAVVAVPVLVAAGLGLTLLLDVRPDNVLTLPYGKLWLAKVSAVAALLSLAVWNRDVATPWLARGGAAAARWLQGSIGAEIAVVAIILSLTAGFGLTPRPHAVVGTEAPPEYVAAATQSGLTALLTLSPARLGPNALSLSVTRADGTMIDIATVKAVWTAPDGGVLEVSLQAKRPGEADGTVDFSQAGRWRIHINVLFSSGTASSEMGLFDFTVPVDAGRK